MTDINNEFAMARFGFHIPPFTSVSHLHLHAFSMPFKSSYRKLEYRQSPIGAHANAVDDRQPKKHSKGFAWFVEVEQAISILEKQGKIGVWSC